MQIANPIYDVVFKYLLDDNRIARKLIGLILGREIIELDFKPTEVQSALQSRSLTVLRLDFAARVRLEDGSEQQILIEIQKAKYHTDIMRFRRYLAAQYADEDNTPKIEECRQAIPIFSIYLLGHRLEQVTAPVIRVERHYVDAATGEQIAEREAFIEGLTHDSIVIQIPYLRSRRRNKLERVLCIFEAATTHYLDIDESDYPEEYQDIIRRLLKAGAEQKVRQGMDVEDEVLEELEDLERAIAHREKTIETQCSTIEQQTDTIEQQTSTIQEQQKALGQAIRLLTEMGLGTQASGR
ncbi:MAG: hypothetical protein ACYTGH_03245 [Planctomycetota bacterium]